MRKFFLDRVQEESVLSGQAFMYLHYADMIANGYHRTMPCPFQSQGLLLNPNGDLHYCENSEKLGNVLDDSAESLYFKAESLAAPRAPEGPGMPDLPQPVPGERRRDEAVRAVREVPEARLRRQARPGAAPRDDAGRRTCQVDAVRPPSTVPFTFVPFTFFLDTYLPCRRRRRPDGLRRLSTQTRLTILHATAQADLRWLAFAIVLVFVDRTLMALRWIDLLGALTPGSRPPLPGRPAHFLREFVRQQLRARRRGRYVPCLCALAAGRAARRVDGVGADGPHPWRAVDGARRSGCPVGGARQRYRSRGRRRARRDVRRMRGRGGCCLQRARRRHGAVAHRRRAVGGRPPHQRVADGCRAPLCAAPRGTGACARDVDRRADPAHFPGVVPRDGAWPDVAALRVLRVAADHPRDHADPDHRQRLRDLAARLRTTVRAGRRAAA